MGVGLKVSSGQLVEPGFVFWVSVLFLSFFFANYTVVTGYTVATSWFLIIEPLK